jgi:hypothetical protein
MTSFRFSDKLAHSGRILRGFIIRKSPQILFALKRQEERYGQVMWEIGRGGGGDGSV